MISSRGALFAGVGMVKLRHALFHFRKSFGNSWRQSCRTGLNLLLPPVCAFCHIDLFADYEETGLCSNCRREICNLHDPICLRCGDQMSSPSRGISSGCENCTGGQFQFNRIIALGIYRGKNRAAVLQTKYPAGQPLTQALGRCLLATRRKTIQDFSPDVIVPIPMHWTRRLHRGTNGPETLAHCLAQGLQIRFSRSMLLRHRRTVRQTELSQHARQCNLRGAFGSSPKRQVCDKRILLVDDVLTTGATCNEATKTLLTAGASEVAIAILARAIPGRDQ